MSSPVVSAPRVGAAYDGQTPVSPQYVAIVASSSGDNTVVAAVAGKKILVLSYNLMANGTVNPKWTDGAGGTTLGGRSFLVVNTGKVAPFSDVGWLKTSANTALVLNLSAAVAVEGELVYALVD